MNPQVQQTLAGIFESLDLATQNDSQFYALERLARGTGSDDDARLIIAIPAMRETLTFLGGAAIALKDSGG